MSAKLTDNETGSTQPGMDINDDYRESEDEDFDPNAKEEELSDDDDDDDNSGKTNSGDRLESKDELEKKYRSIQGEGGLVKTRAQRLREEAAEKEYKQISADSVSSSLDIDSIWKSLNDPAATSHKVSPGANAASLNESSLPDEEYIVIQRKYQFAGKVTVEEKRVLASSAEAKAYLAENSSKRPAEPGLDSESESKSHLLKKKKPYKKKKSTLEAELAAGKAQKMNTLEKSRLDWASFVDKEGIKDDLTKFNKGGYLDKQDFLSRVEHKLDSDLKSSRKKNL